MTSKELKIKLQIMWYIIAVLLGILLFKLAVVQFVQSDKYKMLAQENRIRLVSIKAPRGEIYDRNGKILAKNKRVYTVTLSYLDMKDQDAVVKRLSDLLKANYPEVTPEYINNLIEKQRYRLFEPIVVVRDIDWATVVKLEEHREELPGVQIDVQPLRYYPETILAGHLLGYVHPIYDRNELEKYYDPEVYRVGDLVGKDGVEKVYEKYLHGKDGARQVEVDARGQPKRELVTLQPQAGDNLILTIDRDLQRVMDKSLDEVMANLQKSNPKARVAACVLMDVNTGAILAMSSRPAMDPNDFTRHMDTATLRYYFPAKANDPMNPGAASNRVIQGVYPPGSTFKPITGMAALESGKLDPENDIIRCTGAYWISPHIRCWQVHGPVNYYRALAVSCNVFFQEAGRRAGKEMIIKVAREFGLGQKTGIDLPYEQSGLLPTPEWKREVNSVLINKKYERKRAEVENKYKALLEKASSNEEKEKLLKKKESELRQVNEMYRIEYNFETTWQPFDTFNMSIGQGSNSFTVIQLATYVSALANGGKRMQPYVVQKVVSPSGKVIRTFKPKVVHQVDVSQKTMQITREAMHRVVMPGGTGSYIFSQIPIEISGGAKTGTAQTGRVGDRGSRDYHGVFIAFAPYNNPEVAFAGIIEYGYHGSTSAGLVAKAVLEQYFKVVDHLKDDKPPVIDEMELTSDNAKKSQNTTTEVTKSTE